MTPTTLSEMIADRPIHTVSEDETVRLACVAMTSRSVGALPVVDKHDRLVGMISERDVIRRSVIVYRPSEDTPVSTIMTRNPVFLPPDATPGDALDAMQKGGFRHLPVCADGQVMGIVSIRDFDLREGGNGAVLRKTHDRASDQEG